MHDLLYDNFTQIRSAPSTAIYTDLAGEIPGLDLSAFTACYNDPATTDGIVAQVEAASALGVASTPTIVIVIGDDGGLLDTPGSLLGDDNFIVIEDGQIIDSASSANFNSWDQVFDFIAEATRAGLE